MSLSFFGPSKNNPHVEIVKRDLAGTLMERMMLSCAEIDQLHAHVHEDDPEPEPKPDALPPWCPSFDSLTEAKMALTTAAGWVTFVRSDRPILSGHEGRVESGCRNAIGELQRAMDALGGGPVLRDPLDLDDSAEREHHDALDEEQERKGRDG